MVNDCSMHVYFDEIFNNAIFYKIMGYATPKCQHLCYSHLGVSWLFLQLIRDIPLCKAIYALYIASMILASGLHRCASSGSLFTEQTDVYHRITLSLEATRFCFILFQSLLNLTGPSAAAIIHSVGFCITWDRTQTHWSVSAASCSQINNTQIVTLNILSLHRLAFYNWYFEIRSLVKLVFSIDASPRFVHNGLIDNNTSLVLITARCFIFYII